MAIKHTFRTCDRTGPIQKTKQLTPTTAIRQYCLDCSAGSAPEVRKCVIVLCPLWPFRMGRSRKPMAVGSEG